MEKIKVEFEGIDSWNRPVFKDVNSKARYGSVWTLFDYGDTEEVVLSKINEEDLLYFGSHFGCEPMGSPAGNIEIIKGR